MIDLEEEAEDSGLRLDDRLGTRFLPARVSHRLASLNEVPNCAIGLNFSWN